jgi:hypothetical protein
MRGDDNPNTASADAHVKLPLAAFNSKDRIVLTDFPILAACKASDTLDAFVRTLPIGLVDACDLKSFRHGFVPVCVSLFASLLGWIYLAARYSNLKLVSLIAYRPHREAFKFLDVFLGDLSVRWRRVVIIDDLVSERSGVP